METLESRRDRLVTLLRAGNHRSEGSSGLPGGSAPRFIPEGLAEFAYADTPLPIAEGQTISQPYIVAWMTQVADLKPGRVLEVGSGPGTRPRSPHTLPPRSSASSGMPGSSRPALDWPSSVTTTSTSCRAMEPRAGQSTLPTMRSSWRPGAGRPTSAARAAGAGRKAGHATGTRGCANPGAIRRAPDGTLQLEELGDVRFVPLIGEAGWQPGKRTPLRAGPGGADARVGRAPRRHRDRHPHPLLDRMAEPAWFCWARPRTARASSTGCEHGSRGSSSSGMDFIVAVEADWPDAARIDRYVRHLPPSSSPWSRSPVFPPGCGVTRRSALLRWLRQ